MEGFPPLFFQAAAISIIRIVRIVFIALGDAKCLDKHPKNRYNKGICIKTKRSILWSISRATPTAIFHGFNRRF